ncbi:PfkB family carbohydrate kinase [Cytobacillus praedii]|uniref:PfkB family carbohydrate kinase n=1 Tax=Cytobacillus praedii TaxID=1742358 RepID=UPI003F7FA500
MDVIELSIDFSNIKKKLNKTLSKKKVMVLGDIVLDEYINCELGYSVNEDVTTILKKDTHLYPGNASNVANNICSHGVDVILVGYIGADANADTLKECLLESVDDSNVIFKTDRQTVKKTRLMVNNNIHTRVDEGHEQSLFNDEFFYIKEIIKMYSRDLECIVFSDLGKGLYTPAMIKELINFARLINIPIFIDPATNDKSIYKNANFLFPNYKEICNLLDLKDADFLDNLFTIENYRRLYNIDTIILKVGENGSYCFSDNNRYYLPSLCDNPICCIGAGDSLLSGFVSSYAKNMNIRDSFILANLNAAISVSKLHTSYVTIEELLTFCNDLEENVENK